MTFNKKKTIYILLITLVVLVILLFGIKSTRMYNISSQLSKPDGFELIFTSEECYDVLDQELIISTDGNFVYKRTRFIEDIKEDHDQLPHDELIELLYSIIYDHDFFKLDEDLYDGDISDGSTVYLSIKIGNKEKKVGGYGSTFENHNFREITKELMDTLKPYYSN